MKALLVGYGKMGKAIEEVLVARGHVVAGRIVRGEIFLEGESGSGGRRGAMGRAAADSRVRREPFLEGESGSGERPSRGGMTSPADLPSTPPSKQTSSSDIPSCDVVFEFTTPVSAEKNVLHYLSQKTPVVSGTTGWDVAAAERMAREQSVPFLYSANFSLGVAALRRGVQAVAAALAPFPEFEPGIVERHHSKKKDAPSGTARMLATDVESAPGRSGSGVPIASVRQGGVPGEHLVFFEGEHETLELAHRARSRGIFALGAVRAAEWLLTSGRQGPVNFEEFFDDASRGGNVS